MTLDQIQNNAHTPFSETHPPKKAANSIKYLASACPSYVGKEVCCNDDQILLMYNNFKTIDSLFGNCKICSVNLKRFWWEYTCNPHQSAFIEAYDQIHVEEVDYPVLNLTMRIGNDVACDIFKSCNKNPYVATLASGQSAAGFLEFMGTNAVQSGKTRISFTFEEDADRSYKDVMYPCDMEVNSTLDNYEVEPCTCNYCEPACKPNTVKAYPGFFDGFNYVVVSIVYAALIILSIIIYFIK
jgi:hypothetical protein